jgi:multisubunit Na+/H+ antiporter MnhB subunit
MKSLILSVATRFLTPLMLAVAVFMLLRGHNLPGGGFIGGLLGAAAFCLYAVSEGPAAARAALRADPGALALGGVGLAVAAGFWGLAAEGAFLAGVWPFLVPDGAGGKSGSPAGSVLMFDTGVFLVVIGAVAAIFFALAELGEDDAGGPR